MEASPFTHYAIRRPVGMTATFVRQGSPDRRLSTTRHGLLDLRVAQMHEGYLLQSTCAEMSDAALDRLAADVLAVQP